MRALGTIAAAALLLSCGGGSTPERRAEYDPVVANWYQEYEFSVNGGTASTVRWEVVATTPEGFTRRMDGQGGYGETTYRVVDGSYYGEVRKRYTSDGTLTSTDAYSPPYTWLSADETPGHVDTAVSTVTHVSLLDGDSTYESTRAVTVDGFETVTVPAGTFTALKTTAHITDTLGTDNYNVNWWVRGIGSVKIRSYGAEDPTNGSTWLLTGYGTSGVP